IKPEFKINTFEDLFKNPTDAEHALSSLRKLDPAYIDEENNYIGNNKGIFKIWINTLKNYKGGSLIKQTKSNRQLADILNSKINGLSIIPDMLGKGKYGKRLDTDTIERAIKYFFSQSSQ